MCLPWHHGSLPSPPIWSVMTQKTPCITGWWSIQTIGAALPDSFWSLDYISTGMMVLLCCMSSFEWWHHYTPRQSCGYKPKPIGWQSNMLCFFGPTPFLIRCVILSPYILGHKVHLISWSSTAARNWLTFWTMDYVGPYEDQRGDYSV